MFATLNPLEKDSMATCYRTTWKITSAVALERPIVYALVPDPAAGTAQCLQETSRFSSEPLTAPYCRCWVSRRWTDTTGCVGRRGPVREPIVADYIWYVYNMFWQRVRRREAD
ncbi:uncharacterized protein LOC111271077 [Varroa jacobsoni]|uniref:uncharacterized protein LOC111271077 n=1 Tax=Varroa jacobsoni TaxID=62625 RepID=UPI000BF5140C|nr:uncharacterized protein LOC111271077 [Varroa jacobsoni]